MDVRVWTMPVGPEDGAAAHRWSAILDSEERRRATRFAFARHRLQFIAAHALARAALTTLTGIAAASWRFVPSACGKPAAWIGDEAVPVTFSLSHADGMVGVAAAHEASCLIGFDLEPIGRTVPLTVAEHTFHPTEVRWLEALPASARPLAFLRLWTLKEAFVKATGTGLTQDLGAFWFDLPSLRLRLERISDDHAEGWTFEQRIDPRGFVAALGVRSLGGAPVRVLWEDVDPAGFDPNAGA